MDLEYPDNQRKSQLVSFHYVAVGGDKFAAQNAPSLLNKLEICCLLNPASRPFLRILYSCR